MAANAIDTQAVRRHVTMTVKSLALPFKAKHNNAPAKGMSMSVNIVSMTVNFSNALFMNKAIGSIFGERNKK